MMYTSQQRHTYAVRNMESVVGARRQQRTSKGGEVTRDKVIHLGGGKGERPAGEVVLTSSTRKGYSFGTISGECSSSTGSTTSSPL